MKGFFDKIKSKIKQYEQELYSDEYVDDDYQEQDYSFSTQQDHEENVITKQELENIDENEQEENEEEILQEEEQIQELPIDMYQTQNEIIVVAFIPGVTPSSIDITISKDILSIQGKRTHPAAYETADFFTQELFWGSFERKVMLPTEVDIDASTANEHRGVLTIVMPKLNKTRKAKIKVKSK